MLLLTLQSAWGFALSGPIGNKDDQWQTISIGYGWNDLVAPKNIYEEYRPVVPVEYYASDASFISYFGSAGLTNIDAAFGILNGAMCGLANTPVFLFSPTNGVTMAANGWPGGTPFTLTASNSLDSYSPGLSEFPQVSEQYNLTAETLGLMDIKSFVLHEAVLELGLADPSRYVWCLHDRMINPNLSAGYTPVCPGDEQYLVVQRNFDVTQNNPNAAFPYSSYINGALYYYNIIEDCDTHPGGRPWNAIIEPYSTDNFANKYTAVTAGGLQGGFGNIISVGGFYWGLTQDDAMGLKYLLSTNNINWEATAPSGGTLLVTNVQPPQTLTTLPISLLSDQAVSTNPPNTLLTNYPGLVILSVITNLGPQVTTNFAPYFTNQPVLPVFSPMPTNGLTQPTTWTNIYYFTNQPGPTVINYDIATNFTTISTLDLGVFSDLSKTNPPATMEALYPGLQVLRATTFPSFTTNINYVTYLTNQNGAPYSSPPMLVTKAVSTNYLWVTNWNYNFGNVFTNHHYTNRTVTLESIWITNQIGAPYGSPFIAKTNTVTYKTNLVSGDFFLIPTNWCGFDLQLAFPLSNPPYTYGSTNVIVYPGYNSTTRTATGTNNVAGGTNYGLTQMIFDQYTNYNYAVYPGICEPALVMGTNYTTNIVTTYQYYFGGIVTNHYYPNSFSVVTTTNVGPCPGGSPDMLCTNISIVTNRLNQPAGDFYVVPPAWCGFTLLSSLLTNVTTFTNVVVSTNTAGVVDIGQIYYQTTITTQTNATLLVQPSFCGSNTVPVTGLRRGVGRVQFIRANYDSLLGQFFQPLTNTYSMTMITNGQPVVEYYQRVVTKPDFLFQAADLTVPSVPFPYGPDSTVTTPTFDQSAIATALAGPGTVVPGTTIVFNENINNLFINGSLNLDNVPTNSYLNQDDQIPYSQEYGIWGSFDASTNYPIIYPSGASITNLMNQMVIQVTPAAMPDGTNGAAYSVTLSAAGGQPPYIWAAPDFSTLVPGLAFNGAPTNNTATVFGTPTGAGTFNFTLQLTDSANRVINLNYPITIH